MSDYTVCRAQDLRAGDLFLEPWSGALAKVTKTETIEGIKPLRIHAKMVVAMTLVTVDLHPRRPMRRQWREGEEKYGEKV